MSTMEGSMLIYSEKMKRISRQRLGQTMSMSPLSSKDKKLLIHRTREDQSSPKSNSEGKNMRPLRSFSDASKYKSLRDKHLQKVTKKHSLDMTDSDLLKAGFGVDINNSSPDNRLISSAWESSDCLYKRQRRRGVTVVPKLESLNINENPLYALDTPDIDGLPSVSPILKKNLPLCESNNTAHDFKTVRNDCLSDKYINGVLLHNKDESQEGIPETDSEESDQENTIINPSQISQMVLESFSRGIDLSVELPCAFKDTSAAELKLLSRRRHRLSSSSVPTSPIGSSDEKDDDSGTGRRGTQSESIHSQKKPLRSVLKKRTSFTKKHKPVEKRVTFISPDTIRVISRCSSNDADTSSTDEACQSQNTIVVIRD